MSLMLDTLKRIEAKQVSARARKAAGPASSHDLTPAVPSLEPIAAPLAASPAEPIAAPADAPPTDPCDAAAEVDLPALQSAALPVDALPVAALPADELLSMPWDFAQPDAVSLEAAMDQLQAFVSEADLLYEAETEFDVAQFDAAEFDAAEFQADPPAATRPLIAPALLEEPLTPVEEVPAPAVPAALLPDVLIDGPGAEFTPTASPPQTESPAAVPLGSDPYAATAQQILRQLPRGRSQTLLFTSPGDGQGKTATLARLAPLLARGLQGKVLVVDANFRNPDMARWLAAAPAWRLPDVLAGATNWSTAVQTTAQPGVSLLPGGSGFQGRGRNDQGMSRLLRDLAGSYDLVVVDASSLAHRGTVQLAALCDATYLVVRLGEASPRMLREAAQVVQQNGGRLLGCVAIS
jgi:Mrp family chromosome partitioning ATPase